MQAGLAAAAELVLQQLEEIEPAAVLYAVLAEAERGGVIHFPQHHVFGLRIVNTILKLRQLKRHRIIIHTMVYTASEMQSGACTALRSLSLSTLLICLSFWQARGHLLLG